MEHVNGLKEYFSFDMMRGCKLYVNMLQELIIRKNKFSKLPTYVNRALTKGQKNGNSNIFLSLCCKIKLLAL